MRKVLLATPTYDGRVHAAYSLALAQTIRTMPLDLSITDFYPGKVIHVARNRCIAQAIRNDFDDLVFIDADQDWKPEWFFELLAAPVDCVGAPVKNKQHAPERYNVRNAGGPDAFVMDPVTKLWTCPDMAVGCGFLRLSRKALVALWEHSEPYFDDGLGRAARWVLDFRPTGHENRLTSEDMILCDRLRDLGFETWIAPWMNPGHWEGLTRYEGDFVDFVKRWKNERDEAKKLVKLRVA